MKILYFDCFAGVSGDMILGALVDLGVPLEVLQAPLEALGLSEVRLQAEKISKGVLAATSVTVTAPGQSAAAPAASSHSHGGHTHTPGPSHAHPHDHGHPHDHSHPENDYHAHHGLTYADIRRLLEGKALDPAVADLALRIFARLAGVEAKVHGVEPEKVHFHELGGLDSIADIVGAAAGFVHLGVDRFIASPLPTFSGTVKTQHGPLPLPAPATLLLMQGMPLRSTDFEVELVTPTGAGLLATLCSDFGPLPSMTLDKVGYGAGKRDLAVPNVLRLLLGHTAEDAPSGVSVRQLDLLETELDDMNPELFEPVFERLFALGALDVFTAPVMMKKQRQGLLLTVLCPPELSAQVMQVLFAHTTTLGVRRQRLERFCLPRSFEEVTTPYGQVKVKIALLEGKPLHAAPEYDDCKRLAAEHDVPVREVWEAALAAWRSRKGG